MCLISLHSPHLVISSGVKPENGWNHYEVKIRGKVKPWFVNVSICKGLLHICKSPKKRKLHEIQGLLSFNLMGTTNGFSVVYNWVL